MGPKTETNPNAHCPSISLSQTKYDGVISHTLLGRFPMLDISTAVVLIVTIVPPVPKKLGAGKHLAESVPKTCRPVLAPSWLPSNRAWKTAPGGGWHTLVAFGR